MQIRRLLILIWPTRRDFANGQIAEYSIADKNLLYTPEAFLSDYQSIKASVLEELKAVTYDSTAVRKVLWIGETVSLDDLYLEKAFEQTKAELGQEPQGAFS